MHVMSRKVFPYLWLFEAGLYVACGLVYFTMVDTYQLKRVHEAKSGSGKDVDTAGLLASFSDFWSKLEFSKPCKILMIDSALSYVCYFLVLKWMVQYYLEAVAAPVWIYGVGYAALKLCAAFSNKLAPRMQKAGMKVSIQSRLTAATHNTCGIAPAAVELLNVLTVRSVSRARTAAGSECSCMRLQL